MRHLLEGSLLFQCKYPKVLRLFEARRLLEEIRQGIYQNQLYVAFRNLRKFLIFSFKWGELPGKL